MSRRAILASLAIAASVVQGPPVRSPIDGGQITPATMVERLGALPLAFEGNRGQFDPTVKFVARGPDFAMFLTATEAVLDLQRAVVRMRLAEANASAAIAGLEPLPGASHYYRTDATRLAAKRGPGPHALFEEGITRRIERVPSYAKVRYDNVYSGVDLVYYGNQRQLEYDFVVAPGADPSVIRLAFDGVDGMSVDADGELVLSVSDGELRHRKPVLYQDVDGVRRHVDGGFAIHNSKHVAFQVGEYDRTQPLVIDPVLSYGTYLGGSASDLARAIAVDQTGNVYVTGQTRSTDFPLSPGLPQVPATSFAFFVTKLNAAGSAIAYSTYVDNPGFLNVGHSIKVDAAGNAYATGQFGGNRVFILRLDSSGTQTYGAIMGEGPSNAGYGIAVDGAGFVYITGEADNGFATTPGAYQRTHGGGSDSFVAKINTNVAPAGSLVYSTLLGGAGQDKGKGIAIDAAGNAYVTGENLFGGFPTTSNAFAPTSPDGLADAFFAKLSADASTLMYSTYFGTEFSDFGYGIAVNGAGHAYIVGSAGGFGLPTTPTAYQREWRPGICPISGQPSRPCSDGFVAILDPAASGNASLLYSTYLGGSERDFVAAVAIDPAGNVYVGGDTQSVLDFPIVNPLSGTSSRFGFIAELNANLSTLLFSSYFASPSGVALDTSGNLYLTGGTTDTTGIATPGAFQTSLRGEDDAFIVKVGGFPAVPTAVNDSYAAASGQTLTVAAPGVLGNDNSNGGGTLTAALVSGASSGTLSLNPNGGFTFTPAAGFTGTVTFTYRAVNSVGSGTTATVTITVTVPSVLRPPTNLTASSIVGNNVTLTFTAPADSIAPTGYMLEGGVTPGQVLGAIPTNSTATTFSVALPDGAFYLRMHSLAGTQKSAASNEIRVFVNVPSPPSAPTNLLSLVNGSSLTLAWINTTTGGAATGMLLDASGSISATVPIPAGESASFPVVPPGTYTLSLRAQNGAGTSGASNSVAVTIPGPCSGAPGTPTSFSATRSGNVITVSWQLAASGPAPAGYTLNVSGAFNGAIPLAARRISGAVGPGTYTLSAVATNACGSSAATPSQTVTIP